MPCFLPAPQPVPREVIPALVNEPKSANARLSRRFHLSFLHLLVDRTCCAHGLRSPGRCRQSVNAPYHRGEQPPGQVAGWAFCDGKNGTPNLQGKFLRGSADFGNVTLVGKPVGSLKHQHGFSASFSGQTAVSNTDNNYKVFDDTSRSPAAKGTKHTHFLSGSISGTTAEAENIPPSVEAPCDSTAYPKSVLSLDGSH